MGKPQRQAFDQQAALNARVGPECSTERHGFFHRGPFGWSIRAVAADALLELGICAGNPRSDVDDRQTTRARLLLRITAFAGAHAAQNQLLHSSIPRCARTPASNACFTGRMSVTVSASSTNSAGAPRPVITTCCRAGLARSAVMISASGR